MVKSEQFLCLERRKTCELATQLQLVSAHIHIIVLLVFFCSFLFSRFLLFLSFSWISPGTPSLTMRLSVLPFFALLAANHSLIASALPTKDKSQKDISISFEIGINIETSSEHSPSEGFRAVIAPSDVQWMTQVSIGSQNFSLLIDTGSADLWVLACSSLLLGCDH